MPDAGVVDRLVIATEFDERGLDRGVEAQLKQLDRFATQVGQISRTLPPITVDATQISTALEQAGGDLDEFARILGQLSSEDFSQAIDAMVQELGAAGAQFSATSTEGRALQSAIDALRAAQAQATGPIDATSAALSRQADASTRAAVAARALASVPPPPPPPPPLPPDLARGYEGFAHRAAEARLEAEALKRTMLGLNGATRLGVSGAEAWARGMGALRAQSAATNAGFLSGVKNVGLLRGSLTALALEATGAAGPLGRLASAALVVAGGTTGAIVGIGAIAALAAAYRAFTEDARKAKEAQDDLNDSIDRAAKSRDPLPGLTSAAGAYTSQLDRVNTELERLKKTQGTVIFQADAKSGIVTQTIVDNTKEISKLDQERLATLTRMGEVGQQLREFYASSPQARALAEAAEREARAREQAAEAAKRQLERLLEIQRAIRIEAAGGGNLAQTGAVVPQAPIEIPIILRPALDREQFGTGLGDELQAEFERAKKAAKELNALLQDVKLSLKDIGNAEVGLTFGKELLNDLGDGLDVLSQIGDTLGFIDEEGQKAIRAMQDLGRAIATGDILGAAAAVVSLGATVFGKDATRQEHDRILQENSAAIDRNTIAQNTRLQGGAGAALGLEAVSAAQADKIFRAFEAFDFTGGANAAKALEAALKGTGISLNELDRIARQNGIELLDSKGRVVAGALDQMEIALKQTIERITHFGTTLSDREAVLRTRDALGLGPNAGLPPDVQALARTREIQLEGLELDPALEARIAALDLTTEEGRQAFLEFNRMLFRMAENGELTAEQLSGFQDVDELTRTIFDAATGINALSEASHAAANELSIIPKGFRSAALAFEAQIPGLTSAFPARKIDQPPVNVEAPIDGATALDRLIPEPIQITGAELLDRLIAVGVLPGTAGLPATVPGDGAALPQIAASLGSATSVLAQIAASLSTLRPDPAETQASQRETTAILGRLAELLSKAKIGQNIENVTIEVDAEGQDGDTLAREIVQRLQNISMSDFGRTDRWGQT